MAQLGDGICHGIPFNTPQCGYDGGDCCEQSCQVPAIPEDESDDIEKPISDVACAANTFVCLDPTYAGQPSSEECAETTESAEDCSLIDVVALSIERLGDGVCDPCLNTEEFNFDDGDCCKETCTINRLFPNSCSNFCQCLVDPGELIDTQPPEFIFEVVPAPESTVDVSTVTRAPIVTAFDNAGAAEVTFTETRTTGACDNEYTLERVWLATDESSNSATISAILHVVDQTPPSTPAGVGTMCLFPVAESINVAPPSVIVPYPNLSASTSSDNCADFNYCSPSVTAEFRACSAIVEDETTDISGTCEGSATGEGVLLDFGLLYGRKNGQSLRNNGNEDCFNPQGKPKGWCQLYKAVYDVDIGYVDSCGNPNESDTLGYNTRSQILIQWLQTDDPIPGECDQVIYFDENGVIPEEVNEI